MDGKERVELEVCLYVLDELIADCYRTAIHQNTQLDETNELGICYKDMLSFAYHLRRATSYEEVVAAKEYIKTLRVKLRKLQGSDSIWL